MLESEARFIVACAGARGGKTVVGGRKFCLKVWLDHQRALAAGRRFVPVAGADGVPEPLLRYWVGAPTYNLTTVAQQELTKIFAASGWAPKWEGLAGGIFQRCWLGNTGIQIEFKSGENIAGLVSKPTHGQWWDEGAKLRPSSWHGAARQRLTDTMGWALFTSTPMGPGFYQELFAHGADEGSRWYDPTKRDDEWASVWWSTADNPHPNVRADVEKARRTLPKRYFDREYMASFDSWHGAVFEEFTTDLVRTLTRSNYYRVVAGVDFGHNAPGAIVVVGLYYEKGRVHAHALAEHYHSRLSTHEWVAMAHRLAAAHNIERFYGDPAAPQLIADWAQAGLPMEHVKHVNAVGPGIRTAASLFTQERLTVDPRCVNLIRELRAYRYHEATDGTATDVVVKADDHAPDALRYAVHAEHLRGTFADLALVA